MSAYSPTINSTSICYAGKLAVHVTVIGLEKSVRVVLRRGTLFGRVLETFTVGALDDVQPEIAKRLTAMLGKAGTKWVIPLNGTGATPDVAHWPPDVRERVLARIEKQVGYRVNVSPDGAIYRASRKANNPRTLGVTVGRVYEDSGYMVAEITVVSPK